MGPCCIVRSDRYFRLRIDGGVSARANLRTVLHCSLVERLGLAPSGWRVFAHRPNKPIRFVETTRRNHPFGALSQSPLFSSCRPPPPAHHQIPPYDSSRGRSCSYFRVETAANTTATATPAAPQEEKDGAEGRSAGAGAGGGDGGGGPGRDSCGGTVAGTQQQQRERVILREIPEPPGLPRWSRYCGPNVTPLV